MHFLWTNLRFYFELGSGFDKYCVKLLVLQYKSVAINGLIVILSVILRNQKVSGISQEVPAKNQEVPAKTNKFLVKTRK